MADLTTKVHSRTNTTKPIAATAAPAGYLQRTCACGNHAASGECDKCKQKRAPMLQRAALSAPPTHDVPPIVHDVLRTPGQPLDAGTRAFMEPRFGHDFSGVRVYTNAQAADSARAINALAYTVGSDIVFGAGNYALRSRAGQHLLAHELTHVVQQRGAIARMPQSLQINSPHDRFEREALRTADAIMQPEMKSVNISANASTALVQRFEAPEHVLLGDAAQPALSRMMSWLSSAEAQLRANRSAFRELALARNLWERNGGDSAALRLLERASNENDEANYGNALRLLEQATPKVMAWLRTHPESGGGSTTEIGGREHREIPGLLTSAAPGNLTLRRSGVEVSYGEALALGDFFPSPEAMHNAPREELLKPDKRGVLDLIRAELAGRRDINFDQAYQDATQWREVRRYDNLGRELGVEGEAVGGKSYASLARVNPEHFAVENRNAWTTHHHRALELATSAHAAPDRSSRSEHRNGAYTTNAFGDHFLTDAFAAGHLLRKANYMRLVGEYWQAHREEALDAFSEALLNDHRGAVIKLVARQIPVPVFGFLVAALVTLIAPGKVREGVKDKIRTIERTNPDVILNAAVKVAHDYYNTNGIEIVNQKGDRWRTFGDDHLNRSATTWQLASLAVLRSRADVTETLRGTPPSDPLEAWNYTPVPPNQFDRTALAMAIQLITRRSRNPLADLFIRNLPLIDRSEAFEERERNRAEEAKHLRERVKNYLHHVQTTHRIEDRSDSDDIAREIVANPTVYATLSLRDKGVLVNEMLSGFTGDDDERAILLILRDVQARGQLTDLLVWVPVQKLESDLHGAEYDELRSILRRAPIRPAFDECPISWRQQIVSDARRAQIWVNTAQAQLDAILGNPAVPHASTHALLQRHFHVGAGRDPSRIAQQIREIRGGFHQIQAAFAGDLPFECETACDPGDYGYVYSGLFGVIRRHSDIHLCPDWFNSPSINERSATIIHEMAHKYAGKDDVAYEWDPKYATLSIDQAIDNAECYGAFARDI